MTATRVDLSEIEVTIMNFAVPPTTTVDWFACDQDGYKAVAAALEGKMEEILTANEWLTGRYLSGKQFEYSAKERFFDVKDMLVVSPKGVAIDRNTPYDELVELGQREDQGIALVHKDFEKQPFWKVALVPSSDKKAFAMYVSLSHGVGDGFCFYSLYNMLVGAKPVVSMTPERIPFSKTLQEKAMGKPEANYSSAPGFMIAFIWSTIKTWFLSLWNKTTFTPHHRIFTVDQTKIKTIKQNYKNQNPDGFISTNDIITSWILASSDCSHGLMAMNLRGRLDGHTTKHAFCAENDIYFRSADLATPQLIRRATSTMRRAVTVDQPLGPWTLLSLGRGLSFCTNWAGFKADETAMAVRHLVHLPAYNLREMVPGPEFVLGVIFKPRAGEVAVLLSGSREKLDRLSGTPFELDHPFQM